MRSGCEPETLEISCFVFGDGKMFYGTWLFPCTTGSSGQLSTGAFLTPGTTLITLSIFALRFFSQNHFSLFIRFDHVNPFFGSSLLIG